MATVNYSWTLPTVGGSEDTWGDENNALWTGLDALLGGVNAAEFDILDGATVTTAELNVLDGLTATTAELNVLDGVTATTAEINKLDGLTATTAELNYIDGVTSSIQTQIDNIPQPPNLTQVQAEDPASTVFGQVSGQRLSQAIIRDAGAVGSYCFAYRDTVSDAAFGSTVAGSDLRPVSAVRDIVDGDSPGNLDGGTALAGTWRAMGEYDHADSFVTISANVRGSTLWQRIA